MCGILGASPPISEKVFIEALQRLKHRGPDAMDTWQCPSGEITLGHTRLAILDLSEAGQQPMHFEHLTIVFNGEIYNYKEIKKELEGHGYHFTTGTDTEVILKAWHCWGPECLNKFNGMWAFCIYDANNQHITLVRDRYGIKPLYYAQYDRHFIFASEVQALHKILGAKAIPDKDILLNMSLGKFASHASEDTYLKNVSTLKAGHMLTLANGQLNVSQWYHLKQVEIPDTFSAQSEMLRTLLQEACVLRLRSDVPVGTCLSGGLDSGSISAVINQAEQQHGAYKSFSHKAFCAAFPGTFIDESSEATGLANHLNMNLDIVNMDQPDPEDVETAMHYCDGPMHSLAFFPIWKLYKYIRSQGVTVTLDGQGPDEMLGGYRPVFYALKNAFQNFDPVWFIDVMRTYAAQGESNQSSSKQDVVDSVKGLLINEFKNPIKRLTGLGTMSQFPLQSGPDFLTNLLDRHLHYHFFSQPLPAILQQYDRCSMASSVECRMPFMDHRLVEFIFSLPTKSKVGNGYTKRVLREAMNGLVPDQTRLNKRKIGFNAPIVDWFNGSLKDWISDIIHSTAFVQSDVFDGKQIRDRYDEYMKKESPQYLEAWLFWGPVHITWWKDKWNA